MKFFPRLSIKNFIFGFLFCGFNNCLNIKSIFESSEFWWLFLYDIPFIPLLPLTPLTPFIPLNFLFPFNIPFTPFISFIYPCYISGYFVSVDVTACAVYIRFDIAVLWSKLPHSKSRVCEWLIARAKKA